MDFADQQAVTDYGLKVFKRVEDELTALPADIAKLHDVVNGARDKLMPDMGVNRARLMNAKVDVAAGKIAEAMQIVAELHSELTVVAQDAGTDGLHTDGGPGR